MLIVDSHQDIAWNILAFGRDYTCSALETRILERNTATPATNGDMLLGWNEYQQGRVALIFASLFVAPARRKLANVNTIFYANQAQARELYREQVDAYYRLVDKHADKFRLVRGRENLDSILEHWNRLQENEHPVGLVLLMEGAECIGHPDELEEWWDLGVRLIGPAWAGTRFCGGTREPGPLTSEGFALLDAMAEIGYVLDISHMDDLAALQALDFYPGVVAASHANARALLVGTDSNRNLSDQVLRGLFDRDGTVGIVPNNSFLKAGWRKGDRRDEVTVHRVIDQIDYVCQMAGDSRHVGLGSDFNGGFGLQSVPIEIDTIADLQKLVPLLQDKGYTEEDTAAILGENWISLLRRVLPKTS